MAIAQIIVHPVNSKDDLWTHTFVFSDGQSSTSSSGTNWKERGYPKPTMERAIEFAVAVAEKHWRVQDPDKILLVQQTPFRAAPAPAARKPKVEERIYIDGPQGAQVMQQESEPEVEPEPEQAKPKRKTRKEKKAALKQAVPTEADMTDALASLKKVINTAVEALESDAFYDVPCVVCGKPIPKTGKPGRPPSRHVECIPVKRSPQQAASALAASPEFIASRDEAEHARSEGRTEPVDVVLDRLGLAAEAPAERPKSKPKKTPTPAPATTCRACGTPITSGTLCALCESLEQLTGLTS